MAKDPTDKDMIDDEQDKGNKNAGQEGMLTPAQIIAAEAAGKTIIPPPAIGTTPNDMIRIVDGPPPPAGSVAGPTPTDDKTLTEEDKARLAEIVALEEKIQKGLALTDDDQALIAMINAQIEASPPAAKTFKIGDEEITADEAWKRVQTDWKISPDLKPSDQTKERMTADWLKSQNRTVQQRVVQHRSEEQAKVSRELEIQKHNVELEAARVDAEKKALEARAMSLKKRAEDPVTEADVQDAESGRVNSANQIKYMRKLDAIEELAELNAQLQRIQQSSTDVAMRRLRADVAFFQAEHPQFATSEDAFSVMDKVLSGGNVSEEDRDKALELDDIFKTAGQKEVLPQHEFRLRAKGNTAYAFRDTAQATRRNGTGAPLPELPPPIKSFADRITKYKERIARVPSGTPAGGGAGPAGGPEKSPARQIIELDNAVLGQEEDPFQKELGYQK